MAQKYDVDYFIKKFEAIPDELWCEGYFTFGYAHCALGHCFEEDEDVFGRPNGEESEALRTLIAVELDEIVTDVNDGNSQRYQQKTPKQRVITALYEIKEKLP